MDIGMRIRRRREELGYTQEELAKKLGYKSRSSVNKIENSREVSMKKIKMYADALQTTVPDLMGWQENVEIIKKADVDASLIRMQERIKHYALKIAELSKEDQKYIFDMIDRLGK